MRKRENGLDLLRIIASFFVVACHVCTFELREVQSAGEFTPAFFLFTSIRRLTTVSVICFFLLSGAFVLKSGATADYPAFYRKSWKKLVVPTFYFSVFYFFFESIVYYKVGLYSYLGDISFGTAVLNQVVMALTGQPGVHLWYMYTLIGLYLIAPFLVIIREKVGERAFRNIAVVLCIWGTVDALIQAPKVYWSLGYCMDLAGMFMMGYVAHEWALKKRDNRKLGWVMLAVGCAIVILEDIIHLRFSGNEVFMLHITPDAVYNAFAILAALSFICALTIIDIKRDFGYPSLISFWVYLVHPAVLMLLLIAESAIFDVPYMEIGLDNMIPTGMINTIIVFVISYLLAHCIEKCISLNSKRRST